MPHPSRQGLVYPVYGHREIEMIRAPGSIRLSITAEEYKETFRGMMEYVLSYVCRRAAAGASQYLSSRYPNTIHPKEIYLPLVIGPTVEPVPIWQLFFSRYFTYYS